MKREGMDNLGCGCLIVIGLVAVAIAVQNMMAPRIDRNDTAALRTLRNLVSVQAEFQATARCDVDGDRIGEFGTFGEMTGTEGIRTDATGAMRGSRISPALLSTALAAMNEDGVVTKAGYCFRIFLPRAGGGAVHEVKGGTLSGPLDVDGSEPHWCAYSWPVAHGNSGTLSFFIDQGGDVWRTTDREGRYDGTIAGPAWDAAMPTVGKPGWASPANAGEYRGRDGNEWKPAN